MIDWIKKMWHIYTMEYYAAIKNDEFMSFSRTCMKLEIIVLSKLTQEQKTKHYMFSLTGQTLLDNENTWTQGGEHHTLRSVGGCEARVGIVRVWRLGRDNNGRSTYCR